MRIILALLLSFFSFGQTLTISHPFLMYGGFDFGILDPFQGCSNAYITSNSLNCQMINSGQAMRINLPVNFSLSGGSSVDVQMTKHPSYPGLSLDWRIQRNGTTLPNDSTQHFTSGVSEILNFQIDIWLFGPNAHESQSGGVDFTMTII